MNSIKQQENLEKLFLNFDIEDYPQLLSFTSENNMPGLTFRLAAILRNDHNRILLGGLYPIPSWEINTIDLKDKAYFMLLRDKNQVFNPRAKSSSKAMEFANNTIYCCLHNEKPGL